MPIYEILSELMEMDRNEALRIEVTKLDTGYKIGIEFETEDEGDVSEIYRFINKQGILDELTL